MELPPLILDSSTPSPADFRQDRDPMSLPRKSRNGTRGYAHLVEIDVPVTRVWRALTEPGLIKIWSGQEAEIDPRQGGMYRIGKRTGHSRSPHMVFSEGNRRRRTVTRTRTA